MDSIDLLSESKQRENHLQKAHQAVPRDIEKLGVGVTKEAQSIFDALSDK
ncbi:unnamed protein product [Arabis nemorensis]|uniref:LSM12 anticodon-binding domain-containing protein n=1 Tax=Arabis nemorensis TaxID=586526 RepID=A0A565CSX2_9BRAS|nr:unnamed protein product [Arabis nemorensis]